MAIVSCNVKDAPSRASLAPNLGAWPAADGIHFRVFAPSVETVELVLEGPDRFGSLELRREPDGHHSRIIPGLSVGSLYRYRLMGAGPFPDPCSRFQPNGVHGPSQVIDPRPFVWHDATWRGIDPNQLVIYELHVGTFTRGGTFQAVEEHLGHLRALGVTAIELMPVAQCPGTRNWGYDGVNIWAPASYYGGPDGLRHLVNACHQAGLAVILDVVYNHFGPDGNYLSQFYPNYFTNDIHTPWGAAVNFSGPGSRPVRDYFISNALSWLIDYHVDGLRLDATHEIHDNSPVHILQELVEVVRAVPTPVPYPLLIAEDSRNERQLINPPSAGGYGLDAVWADDLHHEIRVAVAKDRDGYYKDYSGQLDDIIRTIQGGWSVLRDPKTSQPVESLSPRSFVHCLQNHDQIGNRALGDRLHHTIPARTWRAISTLLLTGPYAPLLFMGQEWASSSPFLYFTHHNDELGMLVTRGRREEFKDFAAFSDPLRRMRIPDPQEMGTFLQSQLLWEERDEPGHAGHLRMYKDLLNLRRTTPGLWCTPRSQFSVQRAPGSTLVLRRKAQDREWLIVVRLTGAGPVVLSLTDGPLAPPAGASWRLLFSSEEHTYEGESTGVRLASDEPLLELDGDAAVILTT